MALHICMNLANSVIFILCCLRTRFIGWWTPMTFASANFIANKPVGICFLGVWTDILSDFLNHKVRD